MQKVFEQLERHSIEFNKYKIALRELANRSPNPSTTDKLHEIFNIESNERLFKIEETIKRK